MSFIIKLNRDQHLLYKLVQTMRVLFLLIFLFLASFSSVSQDISNFTQFFINPYTLNPSYAGVEGQTALFLGYRKQWASINGGPAIANFSAHTPINTKLGVGFSSSSDKRGITSQSSALLSISYTATIDNTTSLRFGLSAGYGFNSVDIGDIASFNDPAISSLLTKTSSLIGNVGLSFHKKTFHIGASMPNIFEPLYLSKDAFSLAAVKPFQNIIVHASNRFYFNHDKNVFEPYLIYRINGALPTQFEFASVVHIQHTFWVGASYKQQFGISGLLGFKLKNQLAVGFSYSLQNSGQNQIPSPSYEIQLGYLLGNKKKAMNLYSFVNTEKEKPLKKTTAKTVADRKKQQQILDQKMADDKKKHEAQLAKQKAGQQAKLPVKPVATPTEKSKVVDKPLIGMAPKDTTHNGGPRFKAKGDALVVVTAPVVSKPLEQHEEEADKLSRLEAHADNPTEEHKNEVEHPHKERHEFVKKGVHHEEMDYGDYVIAGVFKTKANAEHFSKGLTGMQFTSDFGFLTEKNLWYVYVSETDDINVARENRDNFRKLRIFRDCWLLTVHK